MAAAIKIDSSALNLGALNGAALNGAAKSNRAAALLLKAGPLLDNSAQTLLKPVGAPDAAASQFATEIADSIKHEMAIAIAQPDAALPATGYGKLARDLVAAAKPEKSAAAKQFAVSMVSAPTAAQAAIFGSFAGKGAAAHADGVVQVSPKTAALFAATLRTTVAAPQAAAALEAAFEKSAGASFVAAPAASAAPVAKLKKLGFFITKVRCVRETSGEPGSDEILLSGFGLDARGAQSRAATWRVHNARRDDFDDGTVIVPDAPYKFIEFDMTSPTPRWPRIYVMSVVLAEEDWGGFSSILHEVWAKIGKDVSNKAGEYIAGGMDAGEYAVYIAKAVAAALKSVIDWLIGLFSDDLIGTSTWTLGLYNNTKAYFDAIIPGGAAPPGTMRFRGDGGIYDVDIVWKVYN